MPRPSVDLVQMADLDINLVQAVDLEICRGNVFRGNDKCFLIIEQNTSIRHPLTIKLVDGFYPLLRDFVDTSETVKAMP